MEQLIQFDENKNADLLNESWNIEMHSNSGDTLKESCLFHIDEACGDGRSDVKKRQINNRKR